MSFLLKNGVKPSAAIESTHEGISLIGCGEACDIAAYEALIQLWGKAKFDSLFETTGSVPFSLIHKNTLESPLSFFYMKAGSDRLESVRKGQLVGISGAHSYTSKHPFGEAQAINLICIDDTQGGQKFIGLGTPVEGLSYEEVCQWLLDAHNETPIEAEEILSSELANKHRAVCINGIYQDLKERLNNREQKIAILRSCTAIGITKKELNTNLADPRKLSERVYELQQAFLKNSVLTPEQFREEGGGKLLCLKLNYELIETLHHQPIEEAKHTLRQHKQHVFTALSPLAK